MSERPFDAIRRALHDISHEVSLVQQSVRVQLDPNRLARTGVPEIILGTRKPPDLVVQSLADLAQANGQALATRCSEEALAMIRERLATTHRIDVDEEARAVRVARLDFETPRIGGRVGILTAGSSDGAVAAEAAVVVDFLGATVYQARDVGVAGLHRLVSPLEAFHAAGVDILIVVAGMDGALPSVVAGLVAVPVIAVPTSVGYGFGGDGVGALMTMLQSCAPGVVVVNVDNGVGAGATAALIANRVAQARANSTS